MSGEDWDVARAVAWLSAQPGRTALFTDFDGTLSPIVARPELALPLPGAVEALRRLASRLAVVGVVSGRPVEFLADRLGLEPPGETTPASEQPSSGLHAYGLHGLEHRNDAGPLEIEPAVLSWRRAVESARDRARLAALPGVEVEDKVYSVTFHWRNAPDRLAIEARAVPLGNEIASITGLIARPGKASIELVPPVGVDKGTVVRSWAKDARIERIGFLGDDVSDLLAFDALDDIGAAGRQRVLKVAVTGADAPAVLIESADLVLPSPAGAVELLCRLAGSFDPR